MKNVITLFVVLNVNIGYSQNQRIKKLKTELNQFVQNYDDENIIKIATNLKSLLIENKSWDTVSILYLDSRLSNS